MSWVDGKTVVVTGGSSGIGKGVAFALAAAGSRVVVAGRTPSRIDETLSQILEAGGTALGVPTDVGDPSAVDELMDAAVGEFGSLDGLVTAAGLGTVQPMLDQPLADIEEMVRTDLLGTIYAIRSAAERMGRGSQIVTIASSVAGSSLPSMPVYGAVKSAVVVLSDSIRDELARRGIRLSCLMPGAVATHFQDSWGPRELEMFGMAGGSPVPHWAVDDASGAPADGDGPDLRRVMRSRDIAPAVLFAFELPERSNGATLQVL
jgi:NAD(P)-dependent dehydrogenase (short-subunit alcohol dehydrogenase family)